MPLLHLSIHFNSIWDQHNQLDSEGVSAKKFALPRGKANPKPSEAAKLLANNFDGSASGGRADLQQINPHRAAQHDPLAKRVTRG